MLDRGVSGLSWACKMKIQSLTWDDNDIITLSTKQPLAENYFTQDSHGNNTSHKFSYSFVEHKKSNFYDKI